jgi:CheY-like chemotaxis protein
VAQAAEKTDTCRLAASKILGYQRTERQAAYKVLVVDDIAENCALLQALLQPLGFEVRTVDSGETALVIASEWVPEVILMDLVMPGGLDGLETTRRLRHFEQLSHCVIIAVSASVFAEDSQRSLAAGCTAHLAKPVELSVLLATLAQHLPLTWLTEHTLPPTVSDDLSKTLTTDVLRQLLQETKRGRIQSLRETITELMQSHENDPFISELYKLTHQFNLKAVRQRLEQALQEYENRP